MSTAAEEHKVDRFTLNWPPLAQGQHTQVLEAIDGNQRVAMKLLLDHAYKDAAQKASLKAEYNIGKQFDHPNIIKYHELVMNKKHGYFTMELFRAPNLKAAIYNDLRGVQIRIKRIAELICLALEHVHEKGWIHKDIKPDNVLLNKAGEVRLIDFSLGGKAASSLGKFFGRKTGLVQGTRSYMSPEQILAKPLTPATDQYSFGILLFEALTGQTPFKGATPKDLLVRHCNEKPPAPSFFYPNVTPEMDRLVLRLLEKLPEKRFKNMSEFLLEFRRVNVFKEPIEEAGTDKEEEDKALILGDRRDSRSDAARTAKTAEDAKQPGPAPTPAKAAAPPAKAPPAKSAPVKATAPLAPPTKAISPLPQKPIPPAAGAAPRPQPAPPPASRPSTTAPAGQGGTKPAPSPTSLAARPPANAPPPAKAPPVKAATPVAGRPATPAPARPTPPAQPPSPATARPPAPARPAPAPARPARAKAAPAKPRSDEGMNIDDLPSFDDLPPVL